jgi:hypothetical protein
MPTKPKQRPATLSEVDREALERAIELARRESRARCDQVDSMLRERDWLDVAKFCAYCCQDTELKLKPWEIVPCWIDDIDQHVALPDLGQRRRAIRLLRKLLALGLSKFEPTPLAALEHAEGAKETTRDNAEGGKPEDPAISEQAAIPDRA